MTRRREIGVEKGERGRREMRAMLRRWREKREKELRIRNNKRLMRSGLAVRENIFNENQSDIMSG